MSQTGIERRLSYSIALVQIQEYIVCYILFQIEYTVFLSFCFYVVVPSVTSMFVDDSGIIPTNQYPQICRTLYIGSSNFVLQ